MHRRAEPLCKAHILPRSFYFSTGEDREGFFLYDRDSKYAKRSQSGLYDKGIICSDADNKIGRFDQYAAKFFTWVREDDLWEDIHGRMAYKVEKFDFTLLNLFVISYLWRCHHSRMAPYKNFSLGEKFESAFREKIELGDGSPVKYFSFFISFFETRERHIPFKFPWATKIGGRNFVISYVINYKIIAVLDSRGPPRSLWPFLVSPDKPIFMPADQYEGSSEFLNDARFIDDLEKFGAE